VTVRAPVRRSRVALRASVRPVAMAVETGTAAWKSMAVTKPNLVTNLDGETTRNIDGKVFTIKASEEDVSVTDKFGNSFPARVNKAGIIEADLANSVIGDGFTNIGGVNIAFSPEQVIGFGVPYPELINGRAAMVGFVLALGGELSGHSVREQFFSPGGFFAALFIAASVTAASLAPAALNKAPLEESFPDEVGSYSSELLPTFWTPIAEKLNGRAAMVGFTLMLILGQ